MTAAELLRMTYAEYLELESKSDVRHEYLRGEVWAMAGGTILHALIQGNCLRLLGNALDGKPCQPFPSDLRIRVEETDRTTYADVTVICGPRSVSKTDPHAVTNPTVIFEVLSESTEASDRGEKFSHYRRIPSLREYVLVNYKKNVVEVFTRNDDGSWKFSEFTETQNLTLSSLSVSIPVSALYEDKTS